MHSSVGLDPGLTAGLMWAEGKSVSRLDGFEMDRGDSSEGLWLYLVFSRCVSGQDVCVFFF